MFLTIRISLFSLLFPLLFAFTNCKKTIESPSLTPEFLSLSEWKTDFIFYTAINFRTDGTYTISEETEGCGGHSGTYQILQNSIQLKANSGEFCLPSENQFDIPCSFQLLEESLDYIYAIQCEGYPETFKKITDRVPEGLKRKVGDREVVTMGLKKGRVTTALKYRVDPDKSSEAIKCTNYTMELERKSSLPKDLELIVLARTPNKEKVDDKWENYWYYVYPLNDYETSCSDSKNQFRRYGWVFGEFVNLDNQK
ncbi:MAG: hypothetical protein H7A24_17065 [Leptospiraceae bacterium]|nr:hypothetical protein [Leptospiraceae bacterium]MCP5513602.1 hypothetical protein [Leptospiraceae bacterium]